MDSKNKEKRGSRFLLKRIMCICSRHTTALNGLAEAVNEQTEVITNNSEIFSELLGTLADNKPRKDTAEQYKIKTESCSVISMTIAIIVVAVLLFLPLKCSSQCVCKCGTVDTVTMHNIDIQYTIDVDNVLKSINSNIENIGDIIISPDRISIKTQSDSKWQILLFRLLAATIVLIAIIYALKLLVPYWTKIADLNDKRNEKLMRMSEEQSEIDNMGKKIGYNIVERNAKAELDNKAKEAEHKQTMERMKQEYQTHLADVALEMVKAVNQTKDKDNSAILNQLLQTLKNE